jgi:CRP-like cAMP-binding protein
MNTSRTSNRIDTIIVKIRNELSTPTLKEVERPKISEEVSPPISSKYKYVWKRVRIKIRAAIILKKLIHDINLYGSSQLNLQLYTLESEKEDQNLFRRASRVFSGAEFIEQSETSPFLVILPHSKFKSIWNILIVVILIYTATATPFLLAFYDISEFLITYWIDNTINILFFIDFIINFLTAYYDEKNDLVVNRAKIAIKYCKGWMVIDLLSWFPFDLLQNQSNSSGALTRFLRLPKLYRLMRLSRLFKLLKTHANKEMINKIQEVFNFTNTSMRLFKSLMGIIISIHICSCLWYLTAKLYDFNPDTWVVRYGYIDNDIGSLYLTSLYWSFETLSTVGYGDITPYTALEKCLCLVWMVCGMNFVSFTIGSLSSMSSSLDLNENALSNKLSVIDEFAEDVNLTSSLRTKLKNSLKYTTEKRGFSWLEKLSLLVELPKNLRYEIAVAMHNGAARKLSFFISKDSGFIATVVPMLQPVRIEKGGLVYSVGDSADEIFFLVKGYVRIMYHKEFVVGFISKGMHFGEIEVARKHPRRFNASTNSLCDLLVMNKKSITITQLEYPNIWAEIYAKALENERKYEKFAIQVHEKRKILEKQIQVPLVQSEFYKNIDKMLEEKISFLNATSVDVSIEELIKKMDELIKLSKNNKNLDKN